MKDDTAMCPSIIRYARPQKARSATGEWKYIVNTGQHTQTLRLEKCRQVSSHIFWVSGVSLLRAFPRRL